MKSKLHILVNEFLKKYPLTIAWRIRKNCEVVTKHLNPGEEIKYAFAAQKNHSSFNIIGTCIVALTNERLIVGYKRVIFGYYFSSVTPDLYNDIEVRNGIIWGNIIIDTVKEEIELSNIQTKALIEIESAISEFMIKEKKKYARSKEEN